MASQAVSRIGALDDRRELGVSHTGHQASRADAARTDANLDDIGGPGNQKFLNHVRRGDIARHDGQLRERFPDPLDASTKNLV